MAKLFENSLGIDLGSKNIAVAADGKILLREPSVVLTTGVQGEVIAVGKDAYSMTGRLEGDFSVMHPVREGAVADTDYAALVMIAAAEKATGKKKLFEHATLAVSMYQGATKVEREALAHAMTTAGAKHALIIKTPVAAAFGMGINAEKSHAYLIVTIGAARTEVAVVYMGGVAACRSIRSGSDEINRSIVRYLRRNYQIVISDAEAEDIKLDMGRADLPENPNPQKVTVKGRNLSTGKPCTVQINESDVYAAISPCVENIIDAIKDSLLNMPVELASDILEGGIYLSGGGAALTGFDRALKRSTELGVFMSEHPQDDTVLGLQIIAGDESLTRALLRNDAAYEI